MIQAPTEGFDEFVIYRSPFSYTLELFIYPDGTDIEDLLGSFRKEQCLTDEEEAEIDSYLIDSDDAEVTFGESIKEDLILWLAEDIHLGHDRAKKIADAVFTWNLILVKLHPAIDAIVPNYQGHPAITEAIPRQVVVTDTYVSDEDLLDRFDPMRDHLKMHRDPSNFTQ
jgi:hypothetical protein